MNLIGLLKSIWDNVWGILPNQIIVVGLVLAVPATFIQFAADVLEKSNPFYKLLGKVVGLFQWVLAEIPRLIRLLAGLPLRANTEATFIREKKRRLAAAATTTNARQASGAAAEPAAPSLAAWQAWIVPLTGAGGVLGVILVGNTNTLFIHLSLLFGALIAISPLAFISKNHPYLANFLLAWGIFGELITVWVIVPTVLSPKTETAIIWGLYALIVLAVLLGFGYFLRGLDTSPDANSPPTQGAQGATQTNLPEAPD